MKTALNISILSLLMTVFSLNDAHAQVKAGLGAAFGSDIEQVGIQGDLHYQLKNQPAIQIGGGFVYYFPDDNLNFYEANLNGAFIYFDKYMFKSYLYTGLNFARSKVDVENRSISEHAFGLNLGIGAEYNFESLLAFGDLKYVVGKYDQPVFSIGIRVPF